MTVATIARSLSRGGLAAARRGGQTPAGALLGRAIPVPGHHARLLVPGGAAVEPLATRRTGRGVRLTSAPRAPGPSADRQRRKNSEGAGAAWLARLTASRGLAARGPAKEAAGLSAGGYRAQRTLLRRHADSARAMPPLPLRRPPPVGRRRWPAAPPPPLRCRRTSLVRPVAALRRPPFARPRACYGGGPSSRPGRYDVGASGLVSPAVQTPEATTAARSPATPFLGLHANRAWSAAHRIGPPFPAARAPAPAPEPRAASLARTSVVGAAFRGPGSAGSGRGAWSVRPQRVAHDTHNRVHGCPPLGRRPRHFDATVPNADQPAATRGAASRPRHHRPALPAQAR